jgi:NADPH-dependent glutamate synthase beta subunit-like oxidoreductase
MKGSGVTPWRRNPFSQRLGAETGSGETEKGGGVEFARCTSVFDAQGRFHPSYEEGTVLRLDADWVILAIGQAPDLTPLQGTAIAEKGSIAADPVTLATSWEGVFSGGDFVTGPRSVVEAIAAGKRAALAIHLSHQGRAFR